MAGLRRGKERGRFSAEFATHRKIGNNTIGYPLPLDPVYTYIHTHTHFYSAALEALPLPAIFARENIRAVNLKEGESFSPIFSRQRGKIVNNLWKREELSIGL